MPRFCVWKFRANWKSATVRGLQIEYRSNRHNPGPGRIDVVMRDVVVALDVVEIDGICDVRPSSFSRLKTSLLLRLLMTASDLLNTAS